MKGITYTQVAQYVILIIAFLIPAAAISMQLTGNPIPQFGFGGSTSDGQGLLDKLDAIQTDLGFAAYTAGTKTPVDMIAMTLALMVGTAGLPHVIVRFYTVPKVRDARKSALYALAFIAILYTTAPALAAFAKLNLIQAVAGKTYAEAPPWFKTWEGTGLLAWTDKNGDGRIQFSDGAPFTGNGDKPLFLAEKGAQGQRLIDLSLTGNQLTDNANELFVDRDIMVLANPEIARLPEWVIGLVAAGGLAAALSTAAGLLLVISSSVAHDLLKRWLRPDISDQGELRAARLASVGAVIFAGYLGWNPPGFVAQVVALAFGLAASSFFPAIVLGIFDKRMNRAGAITGLAVGFLFTLAYITWFKGIALDQNKPENWLFGISPEGIGTVGMLMNFIIAFAVSRFTAPPSAEIQAMVEDIRIPQAIKNQP